MVLALYLANVDYISDIHASSRYSRLLATQPVSAVNISEDYKMDAINLLKLSQRIDWSLHATQAESTSCQ